MLAHWRTTNNIYLIVQDNEIKQVKAFCDWVDRKPIWFNDLREMVKAYNYGLVLGAEEFRTAVRDIFVLHCKSSLEGGGKTISEVEIKDVYHATKPKSQLRSILADYFLAHTKIAASRELPAGFLIDLAPSVKGGGKMETDSFHRNPYIRAVLGEAKH